jgi:transcriptional regulator with XRE-family HTH domain
MSFGQKLKQLRKEKFYSQEQMSEMLCMEQSNYSRYETDKASPSLELIKRIIDTFGVSFEW